MRKLIAILFVALCFSCEKREDIITLSNTQPTLQIKGGNSWNINSRYSSSLTDSVKINRSYVYSIKVTDNNETFKWSINTLFNSRNSIFDRGIYKPFVSFYEKEGVTQMFKYKTDRQGDNFIKLTAEDYFNSKNDIEFRIVSFPNKQPVARLKVNKVTTGSIMNEYILDGSDSFDRDQKYGGRVKKYYFEITKTGSTFYKNISTNLPIVNYIFQTTGSFSINLSVEDDEGAISIIDNVTVIVT